MPNLLTETEWQTYIADKPLVNDQQCNVCLEYKTCAPYHRGSDRYVCQECFCEQFVLCFYCQKYVHRGFLYVYLDERGREKNICMDCYSDHVRSCRVCNRNILLGVDAYIENETEDEVYHLCQNCFQNGEHLIHSYDYTPSELHFYHTNYDKREQLYYGIEIEVEEPPQYPDAEGRKVSIISNFPDFVFCKHDGSIDYGFEIVSHPATYKWLMDNADAWNDILNIRKYGYLSHKTSTCGMHVHMSKAAFNNFHLYKFMAFFYHPNNFEFIKKVSQRAKSRLDRWALCREGRKDLMYRAKHKCHTGSKYQAIRLERRDTVEVRIFRGTLNPASFWKNIEFCKAIYSFSRDNELYRMTTTDFCNYLEEKQKMFPNLYNFLYNKKLTKCDVKSY